MTHLNLLRLARLTVVEEHGAVVVAPRNVKSFSIAHNALKLAAQPEGISLAIDNQSIHIDNDRLRRISSALFVLRDDIWQVFDSTVCRVFHESELRSAPGRKPVPA